jgi:hypothetical protein
MEKGNKKGLFSKKVLKADFRKAQVTIFVIIAIILVLGIAGYFVAKTFIFPTVPAAVQPIYDYYSSCIAQTLKDGANTMESQGGYIYYDNFEPGSEYAPFSSVLDFLGMGVPYWYYISGNGIKKEQVPTKTEMQKQLSQYVSEKILRCDLSSFEREGFVFNIDAVSSSKIAIDSNQISASLSQPITITKDGNTYTLRNFDIKAESNLGELYANAVKIYNYEMKSMFLENYSLDVLYNYAPVSGALTGCSPKVWQPLDVFDNLKKGLSANIGMLKINGADYSLKNKNSAYFVVGKSGDIKVTNTFVSFLYSENWPSRFEVWPTKNNIMVVQPIGTQQGLSIMGFCYAPYKFVYDMYFPVLVQLTTEDGLETFQFPISVVINKNMVREASGAENTQNVETICDKANTEITVNTYDINLNPIEANVKFKCIQDTCDLGKTISDNSTGIASLKMNVPACGNGVLIASADGYKDKKYSISTNEENTADIILDKKYSLGLEIYVDGRLVNDNSLLLISEVSDNSTEFIDSVSYPVFKNINLAEGNYKFDLKVYSNGNINIPSATSKQCFKTSQTGILGVLGFTQEKCVDVNVPSQTITNIPLAGGYAYQYLLPSVLANAKVIRFYASSVKTPTSVDEVDDAFSSVDLNKMDVEVA